MRRNPLELDHVVVARAPQARGDGAALEVYDDDGSLGRFVEEAPAGLDGAAVIRLVDTNGAASLSILHPGIGARARVDGPDGPLGFISRVGRVRANLELHGPGRRPQGEPLAVLRPLGDGGGWACFGAALRWWRLGRATDADYGEARYVLDISRADDAVRPLLVALPVFVDRAVVQVPVS